MRLLAWTGLFAGLIGSYPKCAQPAPAVSSPRQYERLPVDSLHQNGMSGLAKPTEVVVRSPDEWSTWWSRVVSSYLTRKPPLPAVDFTTHMVVVVGTGGHSLAGYSVSADSAIVSNGRLTVYLTDRGPGPGCVSGTGPSRPVAVVRVPRRSEPVLFKTHTVRGHCGS